MVATRAHRRFRHYGPKGFATEWSVPQGAEEADGVDSLTRAVRTQIGKGADWIKVYADFAGGEAGAAPTFTLDELKLVVEIAEERRHSRRRARLDGRRYAPGDPGGRRDHRARRRRHAGSFSVDERAMALRSARRSRSAIKGERKRPLRPRSPPA